MAITKSAQKAIRQNKKRQNRNLLEKLRIKNTIKKVKNLVSQKKLAEAKNFLPKVYKVLDKAIKSGVIKKNTANRTKSRITNLVSKD